MRGPAPQPTTLRILKGNPSKRPLNDAEPQPAPAELKCPSWVPAGRPRMFWREIAPMLDRIGVLTEADTPALAALCTELGTYAWAQSVMRKEGRTYETETKKGKQVYQRPEQAIANNALTAFIRLADRFGMNPAYRSKLKVDAETEVDGLEKMMSGS